MTLQRLKVAKGDGAERVPERMPLAAGSVNKNVLNQPVVDILVRLHPLFLLFQGIP
jgi:hypothetical protein